MQAAVLYVLVPLHWFKCSRPISSLMIHVLPLITQCNDSAIKIYHVMYFNSVNGILVDSLKICNIYTHICIYTNVFCCSNCQYGIYNYFDFSIIFIILSWPYYFTWSKNFKIHNRIIFHNNG